MTTIAMLKRFAWKELRQLIPIWLVVVGTLLMVLAGVQNLHRAEWYIGVSVAFFMAFAGGLTGILLFAVEHDQQTVHFLATLPGSRSMAVRCKLLVGMGGTMAVSSVMALIMNYWCREFSSGDVYHLDWRLWCEVGIWLSIWSMLIASLAAIVLRSSLESGVAALICVAVFVGSTFSWNLLDEKYVLYSGGLFFNNNSDRLAGTARLANILGYAGLCLVLLVAGRHWLDAKRRFVFSFGKKANNATETPADRRPSRGFWLPVVLWQTARQSGRAMLSCVGVAVGVGLTFILCRYFAGYYSRLAVGVGGVVAPVTAVVLGLIAGVFTFWPDQRRDTKRFFCQHPLPGRKLWSARVVPWIAIIGCTSVLLQSVFRSVVNDFLIEYLQNAPVNLFERTMSDHVWIALFSLAQVPGCSLLVFGWLGLGVGQFFSLAFRNGLIALGATIVMGPLAIGYLWHVASVGDSGMGYVVPWGVCWFVASWWLSKYWLDGTLTWRGVAAALIFLGISFVTQFWFFVVHRAYEYPLSEEWLDRVQAQARDGDALVPLTTRLWESFPIPISLDEDLKARSSAKDQSLDGNWNTWRNAHSPAFEELKRLINETPLAPKDIHLSLEDWRLACDRGQWLLNADAHLHLQQGELLPAFDDYVKIILLEHSRPGTNLDSRIVTWYRDLMRWAEDPRQTPETLDQAIKQLWDLESDSLKTYFSGRYIQHLHREYPQVQAWWEDERSYRITQWLLKKKCMNEIVTSERKRVGNPSYEPTEWSRLEWFRLEWSQICNQSLSGLGSGRMSFFTDHEIATKGPYGKHDFDQSIFTSRLGWVKGYLRVRFAFQKFWLLHQRFPNLEEGQAILMDFSDKRALFPSLVYLPNPDPQRLEMYLNRNQQEPPQKPAYDLAKPILILNEDSSHWPLSFEDIQLNPNSDASK